MSRKATNMNSSHVHEEKSFYYLKGKGIFDFPSDTRSSLMKQHRPQNHFKGWCDLSRLYKDMEF